MFKRYQIIAAFFLPISLLPHGLPAQCPITVNAGPDKFVCNMGGTVDLEGSISGQEIGFRWTPPTGLNSTTILNPTATVNGTATYTLTASAVDPSAPNLVTNPGFESGNTGFTSGYTYNPLPITPGTYVLTTSPALVLSIFPPCDDHTFGNGTGNLMLCNGTGGASVQVWCQTIPVMANSWYVLSAWVLASPISPPIMQFSVNGTAVGPPYNVTASGGCDWQEFTAAWFSGAATSANLCILDVNGSGNGFFGDDFAIDDVFMAKACTASDQVTVSVVTVNAVLPTTVTLPCSAAQTGIVLNGGSSSSGPGMVYEWDGPGIVSGGNTLMPTVDQPGVYILTVSFDTGDGICTDQASITVVPDPLTVVADANVSGPLTCANMTAQLNGFGSSLGGLVSYDWQPASGIVSGNGTLTPIVNQPGTYTLLVTNNISGCTATASVDVNQNITPVVAAANAPGTLPCIAGSLTLSGSGSSIGGGINYQWAGPGIVSGANTLNNCVVNAPGSYTVTVTNSVNGCTAAAGVNVIQSGIPPVVVAAANAPGALNCITPLLTLNSTGSSNDSTFTFLWTSPNGHFTSPVNGQTATVDSVGLYILNITSTLNGCSAKDTVMVAGLFAQPSIIIDLPAPVLNCIVDSVQINATQSVSGPGFQVLWTSPGGHILSGDTTLTPWVDAAGNYTLLISNTSNGCTASVTAPVTIDTLLPVAMANAPGGLNCMTPNLVLNSAGSSNDSTIVFLWTSPNGHFTGAVNGQTAGVDSAGLYILMIANTQNGCAAADTVNVAASFTPPVLSIGQPLAAISCAADSVQIDASLSSGGPGFQVFWTTPDGNILSGDTSLQPWVDAAGQYTLTILNATNGCTATSLASISVDTITPIVSIVPPVALDCQTPELTLDATSSSSGPNLTPAWTFTPAAGGSGPGFVSGQNSLTPLVNAPGAYILTLINQSNGCQAVSSVDLVQVIVPPVVDAGAPLTLFCGVVQDTLNATGSATGPNISYGWTTPDGNILQGQNTLSPVINAAGLYLLTVTDTLNGCSATDQVTVLQDVNAPTADAGLLQSLTCVSLSVALDGSGSSGGPGISYLWTTTDGSILSGDTTLTPLVAATGTYLLQVTNATNNCQSLSSVQVSSMTQTPTAVASSPQTLTCALNQISLDGSGSSAGVNFIYQWSGPGIVSGGATTSPLVNAPGTYALTVTDQTNGCTATTSAIAAENTMPPTASASSSQTLTCAMNQISLDGSGSSAGANFSYQWSGPGIVSGGTTLSPLVNAAGTYNLTVTDQSNGCTAMAGLSAVANTTPPLASAVSPQTLNCTLLQISLSGAGSSVGANFTYQWSGPGIVSGGTTLSPLVNAAGTYGLTVTDQSNGCTAMAGLTALANTTSPLASAASPQTLNCTLLQISLSGAGSSVGANFTYQWSGPGILSGGTTLSPLVNAAGTYGLTVTDQSNGCTAMAGLTAAANTTPPLASATSPQMLTCTLLQIALSGAGSSTGANFTYQWSGPGIVSGGTTLSPLVNAAGNYALTVTNQSNGCTATATATAAANTTTPTAAAASPQALTCLLNQVSLSGMGSSPGANFLYQWSGPGIVGGGTTLSPSVNATGTYTLTVTNQLNGCTATAQATVIQSINAPNVNAGPVQSLSCNAPLVVLQGSSTTPGVLFNWTTGDGNIVSGQSTPNPTADAPGLYTLLVTDPLSGCTAGSTVTVEEAVVVFPSLSSTPPDCNATSGSITFSGGQGGQMPFLYSIDGGTTFSQDSLFDNLQPGVYQTVVQDGGGCEQLASVDLPGVTPLSITLDAGVGLLAGNSIQLNPVLNVPASEIAAVLWSPSQGLDCTDCLNPLATPQSDITYTVLVTTIAGCTASADIAIEVKKQEGIYLPNAFTPDGSGLNNIFRAYTNIAVTKFEMNIFDRWGSLLFNSEDIVRGWDGTFRGQALNPGVYVYFIRYELVNGSGVVEEKIVSGDVALLR